MKVDRYAKDLFKQLDSLSNGNDPIYDDDYYIDYDPTVGIEQENQRRKERREAIRELVHELLHERKEASPE